MTPAQQPGKSELMRLFLGAALPVAWQQTLNDWVSAQPRLPGLRWVPAENWHLTVYFFGGIPPEMLENLKGLLTLGLQGSVSFDLPFDGFALAPQPSRARMIWARFQRHPAFQALVDQIHPLFLQIQPNHQMRHKPIPHVTLARLRDPAAIEGLGWPSPPAESDFPLQKLTLYQSVLVEGNRCYEPLHQWTLGRGNS